MSLFVLIQEESNPSPLLKIASQDGRPFDTATASFFGLTNLKLLSTLINNTTMKPTHEHGSDDCNCEFGRRDQLNTAIYLPESALYEIEL